MKGMVEKQKLAHMSSVLSKGNYVLSSTIEQLLQLAGFLELE